MGKLSDRMAMLLSDIQIADPTGEKERGPGGHVVDLSTIAQRDFRTLDALDSHGFVYRVASKSDRRKMRYFVTETGVAALAKRREALHAYKS